MGVCACGAKVHACTPVYAVYYVCKRAWVCVYTQYVNVCECMKVYVYLIFSFACFMPCAALWSYMVCVDVRVLAFVCISTYVSRVCVRITVSLLNHGCTSSSSHLHGPTCACFGYVTYTGTIMLTCKRRYHRVVLGVPPHANLYGPR